MMEIITAIGVGLWLITACGTTFVNTLSDQEKVMSGICLERDAELVKIGDMYFCNFGIDPTKGEGA